MQLIIVGYGRMGREIERIALERGHHVLATVDPAAADASDTSLAAAAQRVSGTEPATAIDFSLPEAVRQNVLTCAEKGWPLVLGTTGWDDQQDEILAPALNAGSSVIHGSNFSVGANLFVRLAAYAQRLAERAGGYDSGMVELHHRGKKDSPSGTALMIARHMLAEQSTKTRVHPETLHRGIEDEELHVVSGRIGHTPGTHTVYLDSQADTVELTHRARSRAGFARGAVLAAEWLQQNPGVHPVEDFFQDLYR